MVVARRPDLSEEEATLESAYEKRGAWLAKRKTGQHRFGTTAGMGEM